MFSGALRHKIMSAKDKPRVKRARTAQAAAFVQTKKVLASLMEKKVVDTAQATYVCDTTGSVTLMNGMAQGTDFTQRVGRKYTNVAVQLEGQIIPADNVTQLIGNKIRVMVIYDKQPNGALPVITDVLTASTANAFMNLNNRDRFRVLIDHNTTLGGLQETATQAVAASPNVENVSVFKKVNLETICDGTGATVADIQSGSIFLLTIGSQAAGLGHIFVAALRIRFVDA